MIQKTIAAIYLVIYSGMSICLAASTECDPSQNDIFARGGKLGCTQAQIIEKQLADTFEQKFSFITTDINALSSRNLRAIQKAISAQRNPSKFHQPAEKIALEMDAKIRLTHATRVEAALSILSASSLLSVDELVRNKIVPLRMANAVMTQFQTDGVIGEQDVVYLALTVPGAPEDLSFGEVTFTFDKESVFKKAYFSLDSFSMGVAGLDLTENNQISFEKKFKMAVESYKPLVFRGYETYLELLKLSAINQLWLESQSWIKTVSVEAAAMAEKENQRFLDFTNKHPGQSYIELSNEVVAYDPCPALIGLNQSNTDSCPHLSLELSKIPKIKYEGIVKNLANFNKLDAPNRLLQQFTLMPQFSQSSLPVLTRTAHWFWEVKVPRALALDDLESISFSMASKTRIEPAVLKFATDRQWGVETSVNASGVSTIVFRKP